MLIEIPGKNRDYRYDAGEPQEPVLRMLSSGGAESAQVVVVIDALEATVDDSVGDELGTFVAVHLFNAVLTIDGRRRILSAEQDRLDVEDLLQIELQDKDETLDRIHKETGSLLI